MRYTASNSHSITTSVTGNGTSWSGNIIWKTLTIPEAYRTSGISLQYSIGMQRSSSDLVKSYTGTFSYKTDLDSENNFHTLSTNPKDIDLTGATTMTCRVWGTMNVASNRTDGGYVTATVTWTLTVYLPWGIETETIITAAKVNEIATAAGQSISPVPAAGNKITRAQYQTLATKVSSVTIDSTKPLASDLLDLAQKAGRNISGSWS